MFKVFKHDIKSTKTVEWIKFIMKQKTKLLWTYFIPIQYQVDAFWLVSCIHKMEHLYPEFGNNPQALMDSALMSLFHSCNVLVKSFVAHDSITSFNWLSASKRKESIFQFTWLFLWLGFCWVEYSLVFQILLCLQEFLTLIIVRKELLLKYY